MIFRIIRGILRPIFRVLYNIKLEGTENLPEQGAMIICANHGSAIDPIILGVSMPYKKMYSMAKAELFKNKLFGYFLTSIGVFPVKRGEADIKSIKKALSILKSGQIMGMFPEGTRHKTEELQAEPGVAMLAVKGHAKILPVAIISNYKFFNRTIVKIGQPMKLEQYYDKKLQNEDYQSISLNIMKQIYDMYKR